MKEKKKKEVYVVSSEKRQKRFRGRKFTMLLSGHWLPRFYARWSFNFFFLYNLYNHRFLICSFLSCFIIWKFLKRRYNKLCIFFSTVYPHVYKLYHRWKSYKFTQTKKKS